MSFLNFREAFYRLKHIFGDQREFNRYLLGSHDHAIVTHDSCGFGTSNRLMNSQKYHLWVISDVSAILRLDRISLGVIAGTRGRVGGSLLLLDAVSHN